MKSDFMSRVTSSNYIVADIQFRNAETLLLDSDNTAPITSVEKSMQLRNGETESSL